MPIRSTSRRHRAPPAAAGLPLTSPRWRGVLLACLVAQIVARTLAPAASAADGDGSVFSLFVWIIAAAWLAGGVAARRLVLRTGAFDLALAAWLAWTAASAVYRALEGTPRPSVNALWNWFSWGLEFFLLRQLVLTRRETRTLVVAAVALAVALAAIACYQFAVELPQTREMYWENPERALRQARLDLPAGSPERMLYEQRLMSTEPGASFALANSLAGFLTAWLVLAFGLALAAWSRPEGALPSRAGWTVAAVVIGAALVLTKSRSGLAAAALGLAAAAWIALESRRRLRNRLFGAAAALAAVGLIVVLFTGLFESGSVADAARSFQYRWEYWRSSLAMIADRPWLGCGPGSFQDFYARYKLPQASEVVSDPHNFVFEVWATCGTPALAALAAFVGLFAWQTAHGMAEGPARAPRGAAPGQAAVPIDRGDGSRGAPESGEGDVSASIVIGAGVGWLLAAGLGQAFTTAPLTLEVLLCGLVVAAAIAAALARWIVAGELDRRLPMAAGLALAMHLLASGGISFPGVVDTWWLVLAVIWLAGREPRPTCRAAPPFAWAGLATAAALAVCAFVTGHRPVAACRLELSRAQDEPSAATEHLQAAAMADPWDWEPWRRLALLESLRWKLSRSSEAAENALWFSSQAIERRPELHAAWFEHGGYQLEFGDAAKAVESFARGVELYPNHAAGHAHLAMALAAAGEAQRAADEAREALRLDETTPHLDQKLPRQPVDLYAQCEELARE